MATAFGGRRAHHHPQQLLGACGVYEIDHYNRNADIGYWLRPAMGPGRYARMPDESI